MSANGSRDLAFLDHASRILAEAKSIEDVKAIRDKAEAARAYARAAQLGLDLQNRAAELKLRAERKAGDFLASLMLRGGNRSSKGHRVTLKLEDLGISRHQSKRWQSVASVSERDFSKYLREANDLGRELTSAGLLRIARKANEQSRSSQGGRVDTVETESITPVDHSAPNEMIVELMNHCQLLANVLRPVYQDGELEFKRSERRIIGRLLSEMQALIGQLKNEWNR